MNDKKPENLKRRGFLLAAGVGSAGAVAVVASGIGKKAAKPIAGISAEDKAGVYQESPHISNYYRTARV